MRKVKRKCLKTFLVSVDFSTLNIMHHLAHAFNVEQTATEVMSVHGQTIYNIFQLIEMLILVNLYQRFDKSTRI